MKLTRLVALVLVAWPSIASADVPPEPFEVPLPQTLSTKVSLGPVEVGVGLEGKDVRRATNRWVHGLKLCYQRLLATHPNASGFLTLELDVLPSGEAQALTITNDTVRQPAFAECVTGKAAHWLFPVPKPAGTVHVKLPLAFNRFPTP